MSTQRIDFPGGSGQMLSARLELPPSGGARAFAIFAHCFTCSKNIRAAVDLTRGLSSLGLGVLRFDFTGLGESDGDFSDTTFSSDVADLIAASRWLQTEHRAPSLLIGHSLGGAAVLQAASQLPEVRAVSTIGAPSDPSHVIRHVTSSVDEIERTGEARVEIAGRPFTITKRFVDDLEEQRMDATVAGLGRALLIFHAPGDEVVGIDNAARLYRLARHPKSFVSLDGADHLLTDHADSTFVAQVLAAWADRYIDVAPSKDETELIGGERAAVRTRGGSGFYTEIGIREHSLVADEPVAVGGEDAGPSPYDYLLAGLGACTTMTLQMYASRKGWPLDEALVRLKHRKLHARDCEDCDGPNPRLDLIEREVELSGSLDDEQRSRLLEIADRCPVHRTLSRGVRIETTQG